MATDNTQPKVTPSPKVVPTKVVVPTSKPGSSFHIGGTKYVSLG